MDFIDLAEKAQTAIIAQGKLLAKILECDKKILDAMEINRKILEQILERQNDNRPPV